MKEVLQAFVDLLSSSFILPNMVASVLSLLTTFSASDSVKQSLLSKYQLVSLSVALLPSLHDQPLIECLRLLEHLSRQSSSVNLHEKECEHLLKYCTSLVLSGNVSSTQTVLCLEVVINLCVDNLLAQKQLREVPNYDSFQHKLVSFLSDKSVSLIVTSLHLLAVLSLKEPLGSKIFKPSNMEQTLQLTMNIICTSFDAGTVRRAVDLMNLLLSLSQDFQDSLSQYPQLKTCLQKGFNRLTEVDGYIATKILDFFNSLLSSIPELSTHILNILLTPGKIANALMSLLELLKEDEPYFATAVSAGLKFIHCLLKLPQSLSILAQQSSTAHSIMAAVIKCLDVDYNQCEELLFITLKKQKEAISILSVLASSTCMGKIVNSKLDVSLLIKIIEDQLLHNPVVTGYGHNRWSLLGVSISIATLHIVTCLLHEKCVEPKVHLMIQDIRVLTLISHALRGRNKTDIYAALSIVFHFDSRVSSKLLESLSDIHASSNDTYNECLQQPSSLTYPKQIPLVSSIKARECDSKQLDQLIEKFKSSVEIQDVRASEIMTVYENKLQNMISKEAHLQDLLDAKSQAISQADRLLKQYQDKMVHFDSECHKLRRLLQVAEQESEALKDKILIFGQMEKEQSLKISQLESEKAHLLSVAEEHKELLVAHQKQGQKLEDTNTILIESERQKEELHCQVVSLKSCKLDLEKHIERKQNELEELCQRLSHCESCLQDTKIKCTELQSHANDQEEKLQALTDLKINLEEKVEKQSQLLDSAQKQIHTLSDQNNVLENHKLVLENQVLQLKETETYLQSAVSDLKREVDLFSAVKTLINKGQSGLT